MFRYFYITCLTAFLSTINFRSSWRSARTWVTSRCGWPSPSSTPAGTRSWTTGSSATWSTRRTRTRAHTEPALANLQFYFRAFRFYIYFWSCTNTGFLVRHRFIYDWPEILYIICILYLSITLFPRSAICNFPPHHSRPFRINKI